MAADDPTLFKPARACQIGRMFDTYLSRWHLSPDGEVITTPAAHLLPVRQAGVPAMLKLSHDKDEQRGAALMEWWGGQATAPVLARDEGAILMARAMGTQSLARMARMGRDDEACHILCRVAAGLHAPRHTAPPHLVPLERWFSALAPAARIHGGILANCAEAARGLLNTPRDVTVLHGDLHHGNVLDFGPLGWLAIDPKGLQGERGFDFANIFTNPDLADASHPVATQRHHFQRRLTIISQIARLERRRLLQWILAWCGLSMTWFLADGLPAQIPRQVAELAMAELNG